LLRRAGCRLLRGTVEKPWEGVLVAMLFGIAYQGFVGFPVFFVSVFFSSWLVSRKV
jgi:hypothetical protein